MIQRTFKISYLKKTGKQKEASTQEKIIEAENMDEAVRCAAALSEEITNIEEITCHLEDYLDWTLDEMAAHEVFGEILEKLYTCGESSVLSMTPLELSGADLHLILQKAGLSPKDYRKYLDEKELTSRELG